MKQVYDFTEDVVDLRDPVEREQFQAAAEEHRHRVERLTGLIVAVTGSTFSVQEDGGTVTEWPLKGWLSGYRRGLQCHVLVGEDDVIGVGELANLRYITLPAITEVWIESRGQLL
jgi:hypothetical protein